MAPIVTMRRPGLARADRGRRDPGFESLLAQPYLFVEAVVALSVAERELLLPIVQRELLRNDRVLPAVHQWLMAETSFDLAQRLRALVRARSSTEGVYRHGETLWLVRRTEALRLSEAGVTYHAHPPRGAVRVEARDEAARRLWAHRDRLPEAARHFAGFF